MNFKKKRRIRDLLRAALVVLLFIGVPVWLLMITLITGSVGVFVGMVGYVFVSWFIGRRFENG